MTHRQITGNRLLLVEGKKDIEVFEEIKKYMVRNLSGYQDVNSIQVWNYEGVSRLEAALKYITSTSQFNSLHSIGITADADKDAAQRFKRIQSCIVKCGCSAPNAQLSPTSDNPSIIVLVVPKNGAGMIEKLCLDSVNADPAMECVNRYFDCLHTAIENEFEYPRNLFKAKLQAFLSSRKHQEYKIGYAAKKKYFCIENESFDDIKEMMALMIGKKFYEFCIPVPKTN
jgi:hypothetical protein